MTHITYTNLAVVAERQALVLRLDADSKREQALAQRICARLGLTPYSFAEDGHSYSTEWHTDADEALAAAETAVSRANYAGCVDGDGAAQVVYVDVEVTSLVDESDNAASTITLDVEEPACDGGGDHDWQSPFAVVGGCKENPGVHGHGGGVIIREVCARCGMYRRTDTWAQRMDTGEQGLTEVTYEPADDESLAWVESLADEQ